MVSIPLQYSLGCELVLFVLVEFTCLVSCLIFHADQSQYHPCIISFIKIFSLRLLHLPCSDLRIWNTFQNSVGKNNLTISRTFVDRFPHFSNTFPVRETHQRYPSTAKARVKLWQVHALETETSERRRIGSVKNG